MTLENPSQRYYDLIGSLVHLADHDYQIVRWQFLSTTDIDVPEAQYDTIDRTLESFLDNIVWNVGSEK